MVCSQSYLRAMPVSAPGTLAGHTAIRIRAREDLWHSWLNTYPTALDASPPPLTLDHTFAAIQAAEDGFGAGRRALPVLRQTSVVRPAGVAFPGVDYPNRRLFPCCCAIGTMRS